MGRTDEAADHPGRDEPAWAERLAQRYKEHDASRGTDHAIQDWTPNAITALWAMFDRAVDEANTALERAGAPERILIHRTMREYRMSIAGRDDEVRQIAVYASLTLVGGRPSGGARITTNQTRAGIILIASPRNGQARWTIPETGTEFDRSMVGDLFLSVFSDDPAATRRLSPHYSLSL